MLSTFSIEDIMSITKTFRNTDASFGDSFPIEAESRESVADDMTDIFGTWANEEEDRQRNLAEELGEDSTFDRAAYLEYLRKRFMDALVEEATGPAVEIFKLTVYQRGASFSEVGDGRERYIVATNALDKSVTIPAGASDEEKIEAYDRWCGRNPSIDLDAFRLIDFDGACYASAQDLGIDDTEYAELVRESMLSSQREGYVMTSTHHRVYAEE